MGYSDARPSKPGDALLFHRLSASTIGAVWFHGRVRDGIGWVTDAMATKLWRPCMRILETVHVDAESFIPPSGLLLMVGLSSATRAISIG